MIWAPITAIAGTIVIGLFVFFVVRHVRNEAQIKKKNKNETQPDYESPYNLTVDLYGTQNEVTHMESEETDEKYEEYETYEGMYEEYDRNGS